MNENLEAWGLGLAGLSLGVYKEIIEPHVTAERAWLGILGGVAIYEAIAPKNHLLSEGVDRMIEKHPVATRLAIGYVSAHLINVLPEKFDLIHRLGSLGRGS